MKVLEMEILQRHTHKIHNCKFKNCKLAGFEANTSKNRLGHLFRFWLDLEESRRPHDDIDFEVGDGEKMEEELYLQRQRYR